MRGRPPLWPLAMAGLTTMVACDASGSTQGGALVAADPCADSQAGDTWTYLYTCYFGPGGKASCSAQGFCHGGPEMTGALTSGYVCGTSREACWAGMTQGISTCDAGATGTDAAAEAGADAGDAGASEAGAATCMSGMQPIVPTGGASDPTTTTLWLSMRGASRPPGCQNPASGLSCGIHNMPYSASTGGFTFTQQDLDRISAWIRAGAQDN